MDDGRLCKTAFLVDKQYGLGWHLAIYDKLRQVGICLPRQLDAANFKEIAKSYKDKAISEAMSPMPDNHLELNYFKLKVHFRCEPYISQSKNRQLRKVIASFRTGSHWLEICKGRHHRPPLPDDRHLCPACKHVDDEQHALFDCRHFDAVRSRFVDLFKHGTDLVAFVTENPVHRLALFWTACQSIAAYRSAMPCASANVFHADLEMFDAASVTSELAMDSYVSG